MHLKIEPKQGPEVTLARILEPFPVSWDEQKDIFFGH